MFVCPFDAHICDKPACRTGICEMTGTERLLSCIECGRVTEYSPGFRLCVECVFVDVSTNAKVD